MIEVKKLLFDNLQNFFGFETFKGEQEEIITNILNKKECFVIMPTGAGKSMCYQLPALMNDGVAIIISPLIALMKNQVDQLRAFGSKDSIAHFLNSSLNKAEATKVKQDVLDGETKLLYVAPESMAKLENIEFLKSANISFVAVDEAHCISEWGHDFRPEYRRIRQVISQFGDNIPIIALTATATPKVQQDIQKTLQMQDAKIFKSSFNRPNLYYEVRPKVQVMKEIIKFIKGFEGKTGIIYCLSRKKVEEVAEALNLNGIKALPYHAGLDPNTRSDTQDKFLMEDVDVIVATIAFGMGIDKPDVRFVIHHDIPKSLEGYYQETGRAGRDGGEGHCLAFYSVDDITKLAKFMKDKPVAEREIGTQILKEVIEYSESSICRRKQILHYFGEVFDEEKCHKMCDNCRYPVPRFDAEVELKTLLVLIKEVGDKFTSDQLLNVIMGVENPFVLSYEHEKLDIFGEGKEKGEKVWESVIRQAVLNGYLIKEIENYGLLRLSNTGLIFIDHPQPILFALNRDYDKIREEEEEISQAGKAFDEVLFKMLVDLRKRVAKEKKMPPAMIFQDISLQEMTTYYPTSEDELVKISGVGTGKAIKFGKPFITLIDKYVEENEIDKPQEFIVKSAVNKSQLKVSIIQNIDRKILLDDLAKSKGISFEDILQEIESIVWSGTKLNISYFIDEMIDEDRQEEVFDYFKQTENDGIDEALKELGENDYTREEIQLMRIKFMSDLGN